MTERSHWDNIPGHPAEDWRCEVDNHDTRLGYLAWVEVREKAEASKADRVVTRSAPAWAWELIENAVTICSTTRLLNVGPYLRGPGSRSDYADAANAMTSCCENPELETLSRKGTQ